MGDKLFSNVRGLWTEIEKGQDQISSHSIEFTEHAVFIYLF